jgi:hypothetical protein
MKKQLIATNTQLQQLMVQMEKKSVATDNKHEFPCKLIPYKWESEKKNKKDGNTA